MQTLLHNSRSLTIIKNNGRYKDLSEAIWQASTRAEVDSCHLRPLNLVPRIPCGICMTRVRQNVALTCPTDFIVPWFSLPLLLNLAIKSRTMVIVIYPFYHLVGRTRFQEAQVWKAISRRTSTWALKLLKDSVKAGSMLALLIIWELKLWTTILCLWGNWA